MGSAVVSASLAAELAAGPMAGAAFQRAAKVWVQGKASSNAVIEYWNTTNAAKRIRSTPIKLSRDDDFAATFHIGGLEPGQTYRYRVLLDGKEAKVAQSLVFRTQALWQWRRDAPDWKLAFGSCAYDNEAAYDRPGKVPYGGPPGQDRIYDSIARATPDMMLWGGDYLYHREADWDNEWGLRYRWAYARQQKAAQSLLRTGHHYAIWDDHEYGTNNANSSYGLKGDSLALFKRYFPNPSYGLPETPGTFTHFNFNDVDFFLTDGRYYRDEDSLIDDNKAMLGAAQLRWLKNAILASTNAIKIVVVGSQVTNPSGPWKDGWDKYPKERDEFLKFLADQNVPGVLLLTGDRHFTALYKTERPGQYPLYELTCSPLTSGVGSDAKDERNKPNVVPGTFVAERNFCTLDFVGPKNARKIVMRSFDADGKQNWEREVLAGELRVGREQ
jgi:alkaline phosphatase D